MHLFHLVRVIACLLSFYLYRLAARNGSSHCIGPKKQATLLVWLFVFFVSLFLFVYLFARLFVCVSKFMICVGSRDCLLVVFLFISFGRTQWLQTLHRATKKNQRTLLVWLFVFFRFFVFSFVYLFARLFVCVSYSFLLCFFFSFFAFW